MNRFQCVANLRADSGVKRLCQVLGVARSSFYYWQATAPARAARQVADEKLTAKITAVHADSDGTYGVPRIAAELRDSGGEPVNHKRVARLMKTAGIAGFRLRRKPRTTVADPSAAKAPDLIGRDFTAKEVNTKYVGDITYLPVGGGKFCYLATVIDLASRRLAGWAIADHMRADLQQAPQNPRLEDTSRSSQRASTIDSGTRCCNDRLSPGSTAVGPSLLPAVGPA